MSETQYLYLEWGNEVTPFLKHSFGENYLKFYIKFHFIKPK